MFYNFIKLILFQWKNFTTYRASDDIDSGPKERDACACVLSLFIVDVNFCLNSLVLRTVGFEK